MDYQIQMSWIVSVLLYVAILNMYNGESSNRCLWLIHNRGDHRSNPSNDRKFVSEEKPFVKFCMFEKLIPFTFLSL